MEQVDPLALTRKLFKNDEFLSKTHQERFQIFETIVQSPLIRTSRVTRDDILQIFNDETGALIDQEFDRQKLIQELNLLNVLGEGDQGVVYDYNSYAVKVQQNIPHDYMEIISDGAKIQKLAGELGVAPKIIDYWSDEKDFYVVMEKLNSTYVPIERILDPNFQMVILDHLIKLSNAGIIHGDLSVGNIQETRDDHCIYIIDYGRSEISSKFPSSVLMTNLNNLEFNWRVRGMDWSKTLFHAELEKHKLPEFVGVSYETEVVDYAGEQILRPVEKEIFRRYASEYIIENSLHLVINPSSYAKIPYIVMDDGKIYRELIVSDMKPVVSVDEDGTTKIILKVDYDEIWGPSGDLVIFEG